MIKFVREDTNLRNPIRKPTTVFPRVPNRKKKKKVKAFWQDLPGCLPQRRNSLKIQHITPKRERDREIQVKKEEREKGEGGWKERYEMSGNERRSRETGGIPACSDW